VKRHTLLGWFSAQQGADGVVARDAQRLGAEDAAGVRRGGARRTLPWSSKGRGDFALYCPYRLKLVRGSPSHIETSGISAAGERRGDALVARQLPASVR